MQYKSFLLIAFASAASVSATDSCSAGAILGIKALCGSEPVDCGSGKCCLKGQKCVKAGSDFKCEDSELQKGQTVTVNAACYGTSASKNSQPAATPGSNSSGAGGASTSSSPSPTMSMPSITAASASSKSSVPGEASPAEPSNVPSSSPQSQKGAPSGGSTSVASTVTPSVTSSPIPGYTPSTLAGPYSFANGTATTAGKAGSTSDAVTSGVATQTTNAAPQAFRSNSQFVTLLSALGFFAYLI